MVLLKHKTSYTKLLIKKSCTGVALFKSLANHVWDFVLKTKYKLLQTRPHTEVALRRSLATKAWGLAFINHNQTIMYKKLLQGAVLFSLVALVSVPLITNAVAAVAVNATAVFSPDPIPQKSPSIPNTPIGGVAPAQPVSIPTPAPDGCEAAYTYSATTGLPCSSNQIPLILVPASINGWNTLVLLEYLAQLKTADNTANRQ